MSLSPTAADLGIADGGSAVLSASSGGSGGGGGGSGDPGNPTISFTGDNVVGGRGEATLTAPAALQSVTWKISGAIESQNYVNDKGETTRLPNPEDPIPVSGQSSNFSFFWDETTGNHTISATVDYANNQGTGTSNTVTVNVVAPTVDEFKVDYTEIVWGPIPDHKAGVSLDDPGMTYTATVSLPADANTSGNFAFIQLISENTVQTNENTGAHTINTGGYVLDNDPAFDEPNDPGYLYRTWYSTRIDPGGSGSTTSNSPPPDDPANWMRSSDGPPRDWSVSIDVDKRFETHLVFRTSQGIWVGLSKTSELAMLADAQFNFDTDEWSLVGPKSPDAPGTKIGTNGRHFVEWTNYFTELNTYNPPYGAGY